MQHYQPSVLKALKKLEKYLRNNSSSLFLFSLGLFIFIFGGINYYRVRILSFTKSPVPAPTSQKGEYPVRITIPSIAIDLPIDIGEIKDGVWKVSYTNATFLSTSGRPGEGDNTVIYGHNKKAIFGNLPYLSLGQKIIVKTQDGILHTYEAYQKDFVGPDRVDLVSPTNKEELTIYTCWGLFDSQRVVVKARPIN